ncbi:MAG: 3-oxoacyl-ACP reductase FabG [Clostridia bacterium]|nr:3-oxoacyl-ACP reductase FabG [Clostridia bacterium]
MAKSVFITGVSGGIGKAVALRLARDGYSVAGVYNRNVSGAEELGAQLKKAGAVFRLYEADLAEPDAAQAVFMQAEKDSGGFYAVINCAGVALSKLTQDVTADEYNRVFNVNFGSVFNICRLALPYMIKEQRGKIINISSIWGVKGASCETLYSASKAAVIGFTKALAREVAPSNIQVNCIAPGVIDTAMNNHLSDREKAELAAEIPAGRFGKPDEIAGLVSFLAGDNSSYITAQVITADGGLI